MNATMAGLSRAAGMAGGIIARPTHVFFGNGRLLTVSMIVLPLLKYERTSNDSFGLISGLENLKGLLGSILEAGWRLGLENDAVVERTRVLPLG